MATSPALIEASTRHQVFIERLKAGEVGKIDPYLREIDAVIRDRLTRGDLTAYSRARLEKLLSQIDGLLLGIFSRYSRELNSDLEGQAEYEAAFEARSLDSVLVNYTAIIPTLKSVRAAIYTQPLQVSGASGGKLLEPFIKGWSRGEIDAVTGAIRLGYTQGRTNFQIIQDIRGTKALNYTDGLLAVSKRHADAVVRTGVQHVANTARYETWTANSDVVTGYRIIATLDSRTSQICRSLDGKTYRLGQGPVPPFHVRCRTTTAAELDDRFKFLEEGATRASKNGYVDSGVTYYEWLKGQSAEFQNVALGKSRGQLFRNGGLSAERFSALNLDRNFKPLTLDQMKALEPLAFERAGLK